MRHKWNYAYTLLIITTILFIGGGCDVNQSSKAKAKKPIVEKVKTGTDLEIEKARELAKSSPKEIRGHLSLAEALLKKVRETGDYSLNREAEKSIEKALKIDEKNLMAKVLKIQINLSEHEFQRALDLALKTQKDYPDAEALLAAVVDAKTELGRFEEAVESAQKYVDFRPNANSYVRVAHLRSLHGDSDGAIAARILALKSADPVNKEGLAWHYSQLGNEYFNIGRYSDAESAYAIALSAFPNYHWALAGKGKVRAAQNDFASAESIYRKLNKTTSEPDRVFFLADVLEKQGKNAESKQVANQFIEKQLASGGDIHRIALYWADKDINLEKALKIAQEDREENADLLSSDTLSWTLYKNGRFKEAKKYIVEAMRLDTKNALFFYHAGMIEAALGNRKEAIRFLEKALEINPSFDLLQTEVLKKKLSELKRGN